MTPGEEPEVVEEAARRVLAYENREGPEYRGTTADDALDEALGPCEGLGDLFRWAELARAAFRRARELRGDPPRRQGRPSGAGSGSSVAEYGQAGEREYVRPL